MRQSHAVDSIVPMAFGNLALNLILNHSSGRLVSLRNGRYDDVPIEVVTSVKKVVDVEKYYIPSACGLTTKASNPSRSSS